MPFHYFHPILIRYNDLDPQGHVNNAAYLVYLEEARMGYIKNLNLWKVESFLDIGIILADVHVAYKRPILYDQKLRIGTRVSRLGNKSFSMEHSFEDETGKVSALGESVLVAYDYRSGESLVIPEEWRQAISTFESIPARV